jgi:2-amino-4-hydroxy-6-hydroxymethyldihydropteridine diphosphokinase
VRSFLGLGANLGDRAAALAEAVAVLPDVVAVSPVYETDPVDSPEGSPPYLNAVVELATDLRPRQLLDVAGRPARSTSTCSWWATRWSTSPT